MMTVVIMFIENHPSNGRGNNSKQLAYCLKVSHGTEKLSNEIEQEKRGEKAGIY